MAGGRQGTVREIGLFTTLIITRDCVYISIPNSGIFGAVVVNFTREVNTVDDWVLTAQGEPHIFHIHVNPFQVLDVTTTNAAGQQISIYNPDGSCRPDMVSGAAWATERDSPIAHSVSRREAIGRANR